MFFRKIKMSITSKNCSYNNHSVMRALSIACFLTVLFCFNVQADEVYLKNGDKVTGTISSNTDSAVVLVTETMGTVSINKASVERIVEDRKDGENEGEKASEVIWKREVALGYNTSRGNTETGEFSGDFIVNRKHKHVNETTVKGNLYYSEADKKMDAEKWYGLGRYAFNFGADKKWYNFYSAEIDHDRFANINYRFLPAAGVGYYFFDLDDIKLLAEIGVGWEHTDYRDDAKDSDEAVLVPRVYFEKRILERLVVSQDFYYYPALRDFSDYRFRSETAVTGELTSLLAIRFSLIDDYNSQPKDEETKKNDMRLMSSLVCSF